MYVCVPYGSPGTGARDSCELSRGWSNPGPLGVQPSLAVRFVSTGSEVVLEMKAHGGWPSGRDGLQPYCTQRPSVPGTSPATPLLNLWTVIQKWLWGLWEICWQHRLWTRNHGNVTQNLIHTSLRCSLPWSHMTSLSQSAHLRSLLSHKTSFSSGKKSDFLSIFLPSFHSM